MSTLILNDHLELDSAADAALKAAVHFWFLAAVVGQWAFLFYIIAFYGPSSIQGHFEAWSKNPFLPKGYVAGDTAGNLAFAAHALLAAVTSFGGAIQLIPQIRARAMAVHRWNGRLFLVTALAVSVSGLYMVWVRGTRTGTINSISISLDAMLIILFSVLTWRSALRHERSVHRRWALRAYLVANGQWFFRIGIFGWIVVNGGPVGITRSMGGPVPLVWGFGSYLLPLAVLEIYLRASGAGPRGRFALASGLVVLTLLMSIGIFGVVTIMWRPLLGIH